MLSSATLNCLIVWIQAVRIVRIVIMIIVMIRIIVMIIMISWGKCFVFQSFQIGWIKLFWISTSTGITKPDLRGIIWRSRKKVDRILTWINKNISSTKVCERELETLLKWCNQFGLGQSNSIQSGWPTNIARGTTDPGYWLFNLIFFSTYIIFLTELGGFTCISSIFPTHNTVSWGTWLPPPHTYIMHSGGWWWRWWIMHCT